MVLTQKVGKRRAFGRGLLLTILTFGIYGFYWLYKAHNEVYRQFELEREGRDEGVIWLILGLILFPFQLVYAWMFVGNVEYVRKRLDLPTSLRPGLFVGLQIGAYVAFFAGYVPMIIAMSRLEPNAPDEELAAAMGATMGGFLLGALVGMVLLAVAYYRLQSDVNDVWAEYDRRMVLLQTTGSATGAPFAASGAGGAAGVAGAPAQYTYWGDLRPTPPRLSAPHVRARAEGLQRDHPGLVLPPEMPDLLARGEAGDDAALSTAAGLMDGIDRVLDERARLREELESVERRQNALAMRLADEQVDPTAYQSARAELDRERMRIKARLAEIQSSLFTSSAWRG